MNRRGSCIIVISGCNRACNKIELQPYLFSNAVAPSTAAGSLKALELVESSDELRAQLERNAQLFRELMTEAGFELLRGPVQQDYTDAKLAEQRSAAVQARARKYALREEAAAR